MNTAEERFNAWKEAESKRYNETLNEAIKRLTLEVKVCEDFYEESQRQGDAKRCMIASTLLSNAKFLLSCFKSLGTAIV